MNFFLTKKYEFSLNLSRILLLFYLISFGFYGALTPNIDLFKSNYIYHIIFELIIILIPIIYFFSLKDTEDILYKINLTFNKFIVLYGSLFLFLIFYYLIPLDYQLFSDEQSYVVSAHIHSLELVKKISKFLPILSEYKLSSVIRVIGILSIIYIIFNLYIFHVLTFKFLIFYLLLSILVFRYFIFYFGGFMSPHPAMNLIPFLFSGVIFGFSAIIFKSTVLFFYFLFVIKLASSAFTNKLEYIIFFIILLTLPIVEELKYTVEPSIWTFILFTYIGSFFLIKNKEIDFKLLIFVTTIFCFLRQPAFLILSLVFLFHIKYLFNKKLNNKFSILYNHYIPFLLFLPYLINSFFLGIGSKSGFLKTSLYENFEKKIPSLEDIYASITYSIPEVYILLFFLFFILVLIKDPKLFLFYSVFLVILISIYFSINPHQWRLPKYQSEYFLPFIVYLCVFTDRIKKFNRISILICILIMNIYYYVNPLWKSKIDVALSGKPISYAGVMYNTEPIIKNVIRRNLLDKTLFIGFTYYNYEFLSQNINIFQYLGIMDKHKNGDFYQLISKLSLKNSENKINYIILSATDNQEAKKDFLLNRGWKLVQVSYNKKDYTKVYLFQISQEKNK